MIRRRRRARALAVVVAALVAAGALVAVGRAERARAVSRTLEGIERVRHLALADHRKPDAYRLAETQDCLLYGNKIDPFGLELCFDLQGRLIEAIDRRHGDPTTYDLRWSPASARIRIDPRALSNTLRRMKAFVHVHVPPGALPYGVQDLGPDIAGSSYKPLGS